VTPGPGNYINIEEKYYKNIPGSKIGADSRNSHFLNTPSYTKPGPGAYKTFSFVEKTDGPKFGFGSSMREKDHWK
jgi:hypothetical protein